MPEKLTIPWLDPDDPFPATHLSCSTSSGYAGLLAAGADLSPARLKLAYSQGIFPWFSAGQPILWWSPDLRMVLPVEAFRCHRSLKQTIKRWQRGGEHRLTVDQAFELVISACAGTPRHGQAGTWIVKDMQKAYMALHREGHAHSIEVWRSGKLVAGLYLVNWGRAVFGESMFTHERDASKVALCGLISLCRAQGVQWIDCQQQTRHLQSLGAVAVPRAQFEGWLQQDCAKPDLEWSDRWLYWDQMLHIEPVA